MTMREEGEGAGGAVVRGVVTCEKGRVQMNRRGEVVKTGHGKGGAFAYSRPALRSLADGGCATIRRALVAPSF